MHLEIVVTWFPDTPCDPHTPEESLLQVSQALNQAVLPAVLIKLGGTMTLHHVRQVPFPDPFDFLLECAASETDAR